MRVKFWGVRGSVPWATSTSIGHGCNTPCVELADEASGRVLILDAGSGIVGFGEAVGSEPREIPILLTHYHWDHLQGLPFFAPMFKPDSSPAVWAPAFGRDLAYYIERTFESPFFPVPFHRLPSEPSLRLVEPQPFEIAGFDIRVQRLNHPNGAFAYRIRGASGDLVYATDHEFGDPAIDDELAAFVSGASAAILDAHFTPDELPSHKGWGHADWTQCVNFAAANDVGHLWLFHHKPGRTDDAIKRIESEARLVFAATDAASEGDSFVV
jgi:phosphoribosyl 1,2-cyclic phosphodiesterase